MKGIHHLAIVVVVWLLTSPCAALATTTQYHVFHILVDTQAQAAADAASLRAVVVEDGDPSARLSLFNTFAKLQSKDTGSAVSGGDLGFAESTAYVPAFADAVRDARLNDVVGPIKTPFGWHVLMVTETREALTADETRAVRKQELYDALSGKLNDAWTYVGATESSLTFVNKDIKRRPDGRVSAWLFTAFVKDQPANGTAYLSSKKLATMDCGNLSMATEHFLGYSRNDGGGDVVVSFPDPPTPQFSPIVPDSIGESIAQAMCRAATPGKKPQSKAPAHKSKPSTTLPTSGNV